MGLFTRKPSRDLEAEFVKRATQVCQFFGYVLQFKKVAPRDGMEHEALDLNIEDNRSQIKARLVDLISEYQLGTAGDAQRLVEMAKAKYATPIENAAVCTATCIGMINLIAMAYYEDYPKYKPLYEMVDNLAKICCSGAAQILGSELPAEMSKAWPYFTRIFMDTKRAHILLWPDVEPEECAA